jgi:hypothetical protein
MTVGDDDTAFVVQFPHPGREHVPRGDDIGWNTGRHGRKFLRCHGSYIDDMNVMGDGDLVFWGEWEAPSRVLRRWRPVGRKPRVLHEPYWSTPPRGPRQNTDPWVFGPAFYYSNCKQARGDDRRPTGMQRLTPGSVIVFGSTVHGGFVVDTVFVVASAQPWSPSDSVRMDLDEVFRYCTVASLATGRDRHTGFTLYRGATAEDPINGMYSFVPARRADDSDPAFERPILQLPGLINPANKRACRGSRRPIPLDDVRQAWNDIRQDVIDAECALGVRIATPSRRPHTVQPQLGTETTAMCGAARRSC